MLTLIGSLISAILSSVGLQIIGIAFLVCCVVYLSLVYLSLVYWLAKRSISFQWTHGNVKLMIIVLPYA